MAIFLYGLVVRKKGERGKGLLFRRLYSPPKTPKGYVACFSGSVHVKDPYRLEDFNEILISQILERAQKEGIEVDIL